MVEAADEGHLLQDVGLHAGNAVEEEDGEDAGGGAEGGADGTPVLRILLEWWILPGDFAMLKGIAGFCLHPEEGAGGVLAELELGDLVAVRGIGVSFRAVFPPDDRGFRGAYLGPYWLLKAL